eukprot:TRINITY_DN103_c0_g1_i3.p1 TRINITY_DN103_c0_g1~~TRINITY_DN103_c0_g1_i3.p1  ORF type:complete len:305 (+),score=82.30 TRINITY_DN103_c0_g1_i3:43-957(+)
MTSYVQRFWWAIAISELSFASGLYIMLFLFIWGNKNIFRKGHDFFYILNMPMVICDFSMIGAHFFRDFYHIIIDDIPDDAWCQFVSIWAVSTIVALQTQMLVTGYFVRQMVADRLKRDQFVSQITKFTLLAWAIGLIFAFIMFGLKVTGPYNGLYCNVNTYAYGGLIGFYFIVVVACGSGMIYNYRMANQIAMDRYKSSLAFRKFADDDEEAKIPAAVRDLQRYSFYVVITYYVCWVWVSLFAVLAVSGITVPVGLDAFAGIMLKLQPIFNVIIFFLAALASMRGAEKVQGKLNTIGANNVTPA